MDNDFSAIKSIQELKNLLDSGAITQQEYEVLKRKIIFGNNSAAAVPPPAPPTSSIHIERKPVVSPPPFPTATNPHMTEGNLVNPEPQRVPYTHSVMDSDNQPSENINNTERLRSMTFNQPEEVTEAKRKDWLLTILISLAAVLLIGLVAYQLFSDSESERLTSKSGPDTEEVATNEAKDEENTDDADAQPAATASETAPLAQPKETTLPQAEPEKTTTPEAGAAPASQTPVVTEETPPAAVPTAAPAAPKTTEAEALNKIRDRLQSYYSDIKNPPFAAQNHFASNVERYYTLIGTTPQAINENINSYHFNEFQESQSTIEDGSMKITNSNDNGYEVTYIEHGTAFRKSKGQRQETTARVRARFDKNFKLTYFRQEQLLENKFIDE